MTDKELLKTVGKEALNLLGGKIAGKFLENGELTFDIISKTFGSMMNLKKGQIRLFDSSSQKQNNCNNN